jgi:hypothetical protein
VKHFCNATNSIPYIQDIETINTFCDGVNDIKTVGEIIMKKPRTVVDLLAAADVCIEALEAQVWLLELHNKGPTKKKQQEDQEVNTTDHGDHGDCGDHKNCGNRQ